MGRLKEMHERDELPVCGPWTNRVGGGTYLVVGHAQDAEDDDRALVLYIGPVGPGWQGPEDRNADLILNFFDRIPPDHFDARSPTLHARLVEMLATFEASHIIARTVEEFYAAFERVR